MSVVLLITATVLAFGLLLGWADRRYRGNRQTLVDAIDALLPQTQCAQCGYPGCRPYAEAVAAGGPVDACPPGGPDTVRALARLLGRSPGVGASAVAAGPAPVAVIDETRCIGCTLCMEACPVDAIVGAPHQLHTVLEAACTGCELCLEPCPVDCIDLIPASAPQLARAELGRRRWPEQPELACIRCGACAARCPVDLVPQEMLRNATAAPESSPGLERCIECGACNLVCPSNIDLVGAFRAGRRQLRDAAAASQAAETARARHERRLHRLAARAAQQSARRRQRLEQRERRSWQ